MAMVESILRKSYLIQHSEAQGERLTLEQASVGDV